MESFKLSEENYLTSNNFARSSSVVFSEVISKDEFQKISKKDIKIIYKLDSEICYIKTKFQIKENDIIFSNTEFISYLFKLMKNSDNLKNIKLITHWSDETIDKFKFQKKPNSISKWFGVHVNFKNDNLISIPLGLSGNYSSKNLTPKYFNNLPESNLWKEKSNLLYINFQKNTNLKERENLLNYFNKKNWAKIEKPTLSLKEYFDNLQNSKFVLCPFGNGYDTHRLWECIYAGTIPIILDHIAYKNTENLPVLIVKDFKEINENFLNKKYKEIKDSKYKFEKLNVAYWINIIDQDGLESKELINVNISQIQIKKIIYFYKLNRFVNRLQKITMFRLNQVKKLFN